ncbi:MAG: hypothetical protein HFI91_11885 [Lachnospiraceae bacterium]|nr:hypothetical protein [Lachnospiraceae bacterium]
MKKRIYEFILPVLSAFLMTWALVRACQVSTFHPLGGFLFIACILFGRQFGLWVSVRKPSRIYRITSVIISALFTLLYLLADYNGLLEGLTSTLFKVGHVLIIGCGFYLLFYMTVLSFFLWMDGVRFFCGDSSAFYAKLPRISFFFCLAAWLPYLLTNYPGVMTVDSLNQYGQIIGSLPMSNHHPWVHTQLIRLFYEIGMALTGEAVTGLGLYTIVQMLIMAGIFVYLMDTLVRLHVRMGICLATLAFYALLPYNAIYMVTMWKDILFSGMVLLYSTVLFRFLAGDECGVCAASSTDDRPGLLGRPGRRGAGFLYVLSGFCMCLLRSNGFYAFLLTLPSVLLCFRKEWKKHLLLNFVILASVLVVKGPVMNACQVASSDFVESLSIPIQLAARVYADEEPVNEQDEEMWNRIVDTSRIQESYQSFCSDHMKNLIRQGDQAYLEAHKADYLKLWLRFGLEHPGAYLRGYIDATKGYWYPDVPNIIGSDERIAENPYGLTAKPLIHNPVTIKIKEIIFKLPDMVPVYGLLFSLGAMFWLCILLAGRTFLAAGKRRLVIFLPNAAIMATLFLATPVYNEFRYAYSLLLTIPLFILCAFPKQADDVSGF